MHNDVAGIFRQALPGGPARCTTLWLRTGLSIGCTTSASQLLHRHRLHVNGAGFRRAVLETPAVCQSLTSRPLLACILS